MVSLLHLAVITEEGVAFQSPHDGADMLLTPEHSIAIQNRLGAPCHRGSGLRHNTLTFHTLAVCLDTEEFPSTSFVGTFTVQRVCLTASVM